MKFIHMVISGSIIQCVYDVIIGCSTKVIMESIHYGVCLRLLWRVLIMECVYEIIMESINYGVCV